MRNIKFNKDMLNLIKNGLINTNSEIDFVSEIYYQYREDILGVKKHSTTNIDLFKANIIDSYISFKF